MGENTAESFYRKLQVFKGDWQRIFKMLFVTCLRFLTIRKETSKCVVFLKASTNFKKKVSSRSIFHDCYGKCSSCEKCSSEARFVPALCTSSSPISLTTTMQVSVCVCS